MRPPVQPVAGADVALNFTNANGAKLLAASGDDGRFLHRQVPAGDYYLFAGKSGFFTARPE